MSQAFGTDVVSNIVRGIRIFMQCKFTDLALHPLSLARPASNNVQLNLTGLKQIPCNHVIVQPALSNEIAVYSALYVVSIKATTVK